MRSILWNYILVIGKTEKFKNHALLIFQTNKASIKGQTLSAKVVTLKENLIYHACK